QDGDRDVPPAPRPPSAAEESVGIFRSAQGTVAGRGGALMGDHCEQTMRRLSTYIDRELNEAEVRKVKAHLDDCPPCEQVFDFQAEIKGLVRKECSPDHPR